MKLIISGLVLIIANNCFSQISNLLIKIDSSSNINVVKNESTMDFFYLGKKDPSVFSVLPKSSFLLRTLKNNECRTSHLNFTELDVNQVADSVIRYSWDFLRRHQFYVQYTLNQKTKVYKVIQKAAFYSEE